MREPSAGHPGSPRRALAGLLAGLLDGLAAGRADTLLRTGGLTLAAQLGSLAAAVALQALLARLLGKDAFGDYTYAFSWVLLLSLGGKAGVEQAGLRFLSTYLAGGDLARLRGLLTWGLRRTAATASLLALALAAGGALAPGLRQELRLCFWIAALMLPFDTLGEVWTALLRAARRPVLGQLLNGLCRRGGLALVVGTLALAGAAWTAPSVLLASLAVSVAIFAALAIALRRSLPAPLRATPPHEEPASWTAASNQLLGAGLLQAAMNRTDVVAVGLLAGPTAAGLYAVASRLANFVTFGQTALATVVAPQFAALHGSGARHELERVGRLSARAGSAFGLAVAAPLLAASGLVLDLFGPGFRAAVPALLVLTAGQLASLLVGSVGYLLAMTGHQRDALAVLARVFALNLVALAVLIPWLGPTGAALAAAASNLLANLGLALAARRRLGIRPEAWAAGCSQPPGGG